MVEKVLFTVLQDVLFLVLLFLIAYPFGRAFHKIYKGEPVFAKKCFTACERGIFRMMGVNPAKEMTAKQYILNILLFSAVGFVFLFALLMLQAFLFWNPQGAEGMSWHLAFNTAASFVSNTNWQSYSGETQASYLAQTAGLTVQNFVSGSVGIAALFALVRGFSRKECKTVGNFWADLVRITLFMLPICFVGAVLLVSQGVPQSFAGASGYAALDGGAAGSIYLGPAASQIIIKQLFTNGGGFYGVNSAYPLENPTPFSNLFETLSILIIPVSLLFTFGEAVGVKKQGSALLKTMTILFVVCLAACTVAEFMIVSLPEGVAGFGNMEGKEVRFGVGGSALWAVVTTSASNGSVNAMHDSFTSLGGMVPMFLMMLGEIVYGGVGCGLYGMIAFALLAVFIAGLMIGRTPEFLGKKIGSFDMKMVCLIILTPVLFVLLGTAATVLLPNVSDWLTNAGAHGFSEILYAFSSMANNNGSAFAGFAANTPWTNMTGGTIMLIVRFVPMLGAVLLAGSLGAKKTVPATCGTLSTTNGMFVGLVIAVILIVGALSFFPALALGPIADFVG